jgi:hypothetical protein
MSELQNLVYPDHPIARFGAIIGIPLCIHPRLSEARQCVFCGPWHRQGRFGSDPRRVALMQRLRRIKTDTQLEAEKKMVEILQAKQRAVKLGHRLRRY